MKQELLRAYEEGRQAYLQDPPNYDNPYLSPYAGLKARKWDAGFEAAMVEVACGR